MSLPSIIVNFYLYQILLETLSDILRVFQDKLFVEISDETLSTLLEKSSGEFKSLYFRV